MIVSREEIVEICNNLRTKGKKIVFTNGCFDIIHIGHINYLNEAKKFGDILIVGLNSDDSVKRLKGQNRPINTQDDRAGILDALKPVDYVVVFDEDTPLELIMEVKPDVLVKGADYRIEDIVGGDFVVRNGGKVVTIPFVEGKSTSSLIQKIISIFSTKFSGS
ncbi:MAG: D-glycero-beta-D-manno-heptose 1-phosphate adenylyltransferase [Ignavibacteria bacterium]|nr:D-glycero-beta-D-manno-heptose 1-phosphate adenylyltransferase [Ignavibacteria bacterium]